MGLIPTECACAGQFKGRDVLGGELSMRVQCELGGHGIGKENECEEDLPRVGWGSGLGRSEYLHIFSSFIFFGMQM